MKGKSKIKKHYLIAFLIISFGINIGITGAENQFPPDYYVAPPPLGSDTNSGTTPMDPFATIQHAIDVAKAIEAHPVTVHVAPGIYYENLRMKDYVNLIGNGFRDTIIDGNCKKTAVKGANAKIEKFTIRNCIDGISYSKGHANPKSPIVVNNMIDCFVDGITGYVDFEKGPIHPIIENNIIIFGNNGIYLSEQANANGGVNADIINNVIISRNQGKGIGIFYRMQQSLATIKNNIIMDSRVGIEFTANSLLRKRKSLIHNNNLWNNVHNYRIGLAECEIDLTGIQGNISEDPLFVDADGGDDILGTSDDDFHLTGNSPCIDAGMIEGAPLEDFEGDPRPIDGNDDGTEIVDIGVDEYVFEITMDAILDFFDNRVSDKTIYGRGREPSLAIERLWIFEEKLESARWLLEHDRVPGACKKLNRMKELCDGDPWQTDLIIGEAVPDLSEMILELMENLECKESY